MSAHCDFNTAIVAIVTQYDQKQSKRKFYNIYALPQYLKAVENVCEMVNKGSTIDSAIKFQFSGDLQAYVLKHVERWQADGLYPMPTKRRTKAI